MSSFSDIDDYYIWEKLLYFKVNITFLISINIKLKLKRLIHPCLIKPGMVRQIAPN